MIGYFSIQSTLPITKPLGNNCIERRGNAFTFDGHEAGVVEVVVVVPRLAAEGVRIVPLLLLLLLLLQWRRLQASSEGRPLETAI